jgi:hypothetical protein
VFKAIEKVVEDHEGLNNPKSYVHGLASAIAAVARSHIGIDDSEAGEADDSEAVEAVARKLAQNFHRACRYYGFLDASCAFARRGRSMTHTREGLRLAFHGYSAQKAIAFMVEEQDRFLFGTTNLPRRLANLLLIATKRLTGSPRGYTPHDITTDSYDPAVEAPDAVTNSLATVPFDDYSTGTDETSAHHECHERRERSEEPEAPEPSVPASKRTRLA